MNGSMENIYTHLIDSIKSNHSWIGIPIRFVPWDPIEIIAGVEDPEESFHPVFSEGPIADS